ncbi:uncharacterized protein ARMOST_21321 [Armillaria ostoyae]|uniref:Uncharacterized protein n=1 Tax=Armillaria ostoyae TaxID=47428 RepID=A0A284S9S0_ARMOS|nr:uncharacterized protein ARMOST_21321 [Armillaria ostoyae]
MKDDQNLWDIQVHGKPVGLSHLAPSSLPSFGREPLRDCLYELLHGTLLHIPLFSTPPFVIPMSTHQGRNRYSSQPPRPGCYIPPGRASTTMVAQARPNLVLVVALVLFVVVGLISMVSSFHVPSSQPIMFHSYIPFTWVFRLEGLTQLFIPLAYSNRPYPVCVF